jgi:hypothetical protein
MTQKTQEIARGLFIPTESDICFVWVMEGIFSTSASIHEAPKAPSHPLAPARLHHDFATSSNVDHIPLDNFFTPHSVSQASDPAPFQDLRRSLSLARQRTTITDISQNKTFMPIPFGGF